MSSLDHKSLPELRKFLTLENANVYKTFFELVVKGDGSVADVKRELNRDDQSGIAKVIDALNKKTNNAFSSNLVWQTSDKRWVATPLGEALYEVAKKIEEIASEMEEAFSDISQVPIIRVGVNSFSYEELLSIEDRVRSVFGEVDYKKIVHGHRSSELLHEDPEDEHLDIAISEYTNELVGEARRDYKKISQNKIHFLSNHPITAKNKYGQNGHCETCVSFREIKNHPILLGDTRSFIDLYVLNSSYGESLGADQQQKLKHIWNMDFEEKKEIVRREYPVSHESTSVHLMMDMFIFDPMPLCMLATKEVLEHIRARTNVLLASDNGRKINNVFVHPLCDEKISLHKYALRHISPRTSAETPRSIAQMFWEACEEIEEELLSQQSNSE